MKAQTVILKNNGNELLDFNLKFRVLTNGKRYDGFIHDTYSNAKLRKDVMSRIAPHSVHEIVTLES